jgi:hypothetical protein
MRAWRLIALLVVLLFPAAALAAVSQTTLHVTARMPSQALVGTPIRIRTTITNRGPSVAHGVTVSVGVEKLTGAGARPGLILTGPVQARIAKLAVGKSNTVTLTVTVRATPHGLSYFGPGTYNIGPSINLRSPTTVHIRGAGSNVSRANITLS